MKGVELGTVALVGLVLIGGALVTVPGLGGSIQSIVTGPQPCNIAPFDPNCECFGDTERILLHMGIYYICEPIEKLIEEILTHEVLHLVIEHLEGLKTSFMLDNIVRWILEKKEFKIEIATKEKRKS